jgi:cyclic pyranopterin phosphate synthase
MPEEMVFRRRAELLTFEEISRIVGIFAERGVQRVRLTGGEPTVRAGIVDIVALVAKTPGIEQVVMTSNGERFVELAPSLAAAGLAEVNVSIDTLDADKFRQITRRGQLSKVIAGIDAALDAGIRVKLNAVALRDINEDEIVSLCEFAWRRGVLLRFIEHMPMSGGALYSTSRQLTAASIRARIAEHMGADLIADSPTSFAEGPSRYWHVDGDTDRRVGIISAMSEHFCDTCNRVRLSAIGELHACLAFDDAISLRDVLRAGGSDDDIRAAIEASLTGKRAGHEFQSTGVGAPTKHMIQIGG